MASQELAFLRQFVDKETDNMIEKFTSIGAAGTYDDLLAIILQFKDTIQRINKNVINDVPIEIMKRSSHSSTSKLN